MELALRLGRIELGNVSPNPAVGAVIVSNDGSRILGRGWTQRGGRPHAETQALMQAASLYGADTPRGATMYVTLEPCSHRAKTPPCAQALIDAGIARVVIPIEDPDKRVSGSGVQALQAAGIEVVEFVDSAAALISCGLNMTQ
jgi:diaminohydroxyphosphoribosylaminopyrimidine deaminase/5-amino-6-(5-phosphoribosylamino)uracil reductase